MALCNGVTRHRYGLAPAFVLVPARGAGAISPGLNQDGARANLRG